MRTLAPLFLMAAAAAQATPTFPDIVLTALPGNPATQLVAFDRGLGTVTALPRFPSDGLAPRAVAIDPYDRALYVALDVAAAGSQIVRLDRAGAGFTEHGITTLPGPVTGLAVAGDSLYAAVDDPQGGLFRVPRRGGAATRTVHLANATAMQGFGPGQAVFSIAWTGRQGTTQPLSGFVVLDGDTGAQFFGPMSFANPTGLTLTGVADLWTAVPRHVLAFADGTFALVTNLQPPVAPFAMPPVPAGGAVALLHATIAGGDPIALGGAPFPYLYGIDAQNQTFLWQSPALPGAPVAFAAGATRGSQSIGIGDTACGTTVLSQGVGGLPQPGNTLTFWNQGPANTAVLLIASLEDFAGGALPFQLPGGCSLQIAPTATLVLVGNANGVAAHALAIPSFQGLLGTILFTQWLALDGSLATSATLAHWIGL